MACHDIMSFPVITKQNPLILASASPRRKRLLAQAGLPFRAEASNINEGNTVGDPAQISGLLAEKKAGRIYSKIRDCWILGADTTVVADNGILGKPVDRKEAKQMLMLLNGREHHVITGFCLLYPSGKIGHSEKVITAVRFKKLTEQEIEGYISSGEPYGKAGGYAIQGIGAFMVESISGSYTNVVGLPLCALIKALVSIKAVKDFP